jgi:hypothetical protein
MRVHMPPSIEAKDRGIRKLAGSCPIWTAHTSTMEIITAERVERG